jgi:hypothetical protein
VAFVMLPRMLPDRPYFTFACALTIAGKNGKIFSSESVPPRPEIPLLSKSFDGPIKDRIVPV